MKPLVKGQETGLVEIPANWYIDDLPPMMFMRKVPNSHGFVNARDVEDIWRVRAVTFWWLGPKLTMKQDHFDYFYREYDEFIFPMTVHPDVSGQPHALLMHERLIEHINRHEGVEWVTMGQIVDESKSKNKPAEGALMPAARGAILNENRRN